MVVRKSSPRLALWLCSISFTVGSQAAELIRVGPGDGLMGGSEAVRVPRGALAYTSQVLATDLGGRVVGPGNSAVQMDRAFENLALALAEADTSLERIVRLNAVVDSPEVGHALARSIKARFPSESRPAVTLVEGNLPLPGALIALDAVAFIGTGRADGDREVRLAPDELASSSGTSPWAVLPAGPRVYVSGRAAEGEPAVAAADALRQLEETIAFVGLDRSHLVQLKCFLRPISAACEVRSRLEQHFSGAVPPLVFIEWQHPLTIEIEAVAAAGTATEQGAPAIEYLTPPGDRDSPVFSRLVRITHPESIFVSTLNGHTDDQGETQILEMFSDLARILSNAGSDLKHLAKATYYVSDGFTGQKLNELRPEFYDPARPPAASKVPVRGTAVTARSLAVDMIAIPRP